MKIIQFNIDPSQIKNGIIGDAEKKLPFKNNSFDFVFLGEVIEHISNTDLLLTEINRILKPRGIGIITTPNLVSFLNRILFLFGKLPVGYYVSSKLVVDRPLIKNRKCPFGKRGHVKLFTLRALKELLEFYGFEILEVKGYNNTDRWRKFRLLRVLFSFLPVTWKEGLIIKFKKIHNLRTT